MNRTPWDVMQELREEGLGSGLEIVWDSGIRAWLRKPDADDMSLTERDELQQWFGPAEFEKISEWLESQAAATFGYKPVRQAADPYN
jgi:hypothetical protein